MTRPANPRLLRGLALVVGLGCVAWGCDQKNTGGGKLTPVKGEGDPVVLIMKDNVPYITANVADDVPALKKAEAAGQQEALMRKALQLVIERGLKEERAAGKELFQVKLMVLHELDEYGKAKTGSSIELATFDVVRKDVEGLTPSAVAGLTGDDLRKPFRSANFNLGNLDKFE
jgi:hypothetical protein